MTIKLVKSTFYNEAITREELSQFILGGTHLSYGQECVKFESALAEWQGSKYAVMFSSGSTANFALIQALLNCGYLNRGDKVGFSAVTWPTNVVPLMQLGLIPIPIDVELDTLNISSRTLQDTLNKHTLSGLFMTHVLGLVDDLHEIVNICKRNKIVLFEDACEAFGTVYQGKKVGSFGVGGTFSFFVGHHMSTIEGGMVVTDDPDLCRELKMIRSHGWDRHLEPHEQTTLRQRHGVDEFYALYTFYNSGNNFRPTEISGFLGNNQLKYADTIVTNREKNFHLLRDAINSRHDLYYPIKTDHIDVVSNFAFPLIARSKHIQETMRNRSKGIIEVRPVIAGNMTKQPFYMNTNQQMESLPNSDIIHNQGLYFGNNPELTDDDIAAMISIFSNEDCI